MDFCLVWFGLVWFDSGAFRAGRLHKQDPNLPCRHASPRHLQRRQKSLLHARGSEDFVRSMAMPSTALYRHVCPVCSLPWLPPPPPPPPPLADATRMLHHALCTTHSAPRSGTRRATHYWPRSLIKTRRSSMGPQQAASLLASRMTSTPCSSPLYPPSPPPYTTWYCSWAAWSCVSTPRTS